MTCRELTDFIADYLAGELAREAHERFERHLSRCADCRHYLARYAATIKLGRDAFHDQESDVPRDVPAELIEGILAARRS